MKARAGCLLTLLTAALAGCGGDDDTAAKADTAKTVSGQANIFGAGQAAPEAPEGGGIGVMPPVWRLPDGTRVVRIRAAGRVNPIVGQAQWNGPGGDGVGTTDVNSWHGISGIVHRRNGMFLVGVLLGDDKPPIKGPPRLNFTRRERFTSLAPRIGQTFFVGDGRGRSYRVPDGASRLFLGFADSYYYQGNPGWYGNNGGRLRVTVGLASG